MYICMYVTTNSNKQYEALAGTLSEPATKGQLWQFDYLQKQKKAYTSHRTVRLNLYDVLIIKDDIMCLTTFPNSQKRVEKNATQHSIFDGLELIGNTDKLGLECQLCTLYNQSYQDPVSKHYEGQISF